MTARTFTRTTLIPVPADQVWERVVTAEGINDEMRPLMSMRLPRSSGITSIADVTVGEPVGKAWLRLFGVVPFDYDDLLVAEIEPGRRFLETSTMLSMRRWEHERTLTPVPGGTDVTDRITIEPRMPLPGLATVLSRLLPLFFAHRHRRLGRHFAPHRRRRNPASR